MKGSINFDNDLRVEFLYINEKNKKHPLLSGIRFISFEKVVDFHSKDVELLNFLKEFLSKRVILKGINGTYKQLQALGKGNYSQVALMENIYTRKVFAVKKIDNETLIKTCKSKVKWKFKFRMLYSMRL